MKKIVFVSHCVLNVASKVESYKEQPTKEELYRKKFLQGCLEYNINLVQLPCPEQLQFGLNRWGHSREQFDFPGFRGEMKKMLAPIMNLLQEYQGNNECKVYGVVGINGSPSCGIDYSFSAPWKGEVGSNPHLEEMLQKGTIANRSGVFIEVLKELLKECGITLPIVALSDNTLQCLGVDKE